jgi:plastocyanin
MLVRYLASAILLLATSAAPARSQRVHQVRLLHPSEQKFLFEPVRVTAKPGEVLEFIVESGGPYVVGFEPADLPAAARTLLDQAIPDPSGTLRGPVLAGPRSSFRIVLPALPKGNYRFSSVTHVAYRMGGILTMER